jgi:uncharacterized protein YbjT (DUF2867 family)
MTDPALDRSVRPRIAVAGASGFVGTALCPALADDFEVTALTRSPARARIGDRDRRIRWRHCDLFSIDAVQAALAGIDYAVYLVHSQAPSSRLTQATPQDLDLILADNFARAAAANGVRQIVVVGGVLPDGFRVSPLLWSRREIELVLAGHGVPVTALRASLIVGPGGSGPALLVDLVRRLPLLALPPQARSLTRPIALTDAVRAIRHCLGRPDQCRGSFDIGGPDCLSYAEMLRQTAAILGRRRVFVPLPWLPLRLANWIARLVSGAPAQLVGAIVESLPQDTRMHDNPVQEAIAPGSVGFRAALAEAIDPASGRLRPSPRRPIQGRDQALIRRQSLVRSIQRVTLPPGQDAPWVAGNYFRWLGRAFWPLVRTRIAEDDSVRVMLMGLLLLELIHLPERSTSERQVYRIAGGLLARGDGVGEPRFEFQTLLDRRYTMTAIHDYAPSLPWWLYIPTQATAHRLVMRWYQSMLAALAR